MAEPLSPHIIEELRRYDSATVANAIEHFNVRDPVTGYANNQLVCQFPQLKPMVGYAVTVTGDTTTPGDTRTSRVDDLVELVNAAPKPLILVIKHIGYDRTRACYVGDMFCTILEKLGAVGVVTDGNARDRTGIAQRTPNFQLFTSGWVVSHGYGAYVDLNVPVSLCGMEIKPGDLLHGDESGLVSVPLDIAGEVAKQAQAVRDVESEYFEWLESDRFGMEELRRRIVPHE